CGCRTAITSSWPTLPRQGRSIEDIRTGAGGGAVMDFYDVLDQVVELLRRRNRVTYRALKLQFKLDDEALEILKDELLKAQRLAVDEAGEVLVWIGDTTTAQAHSQPTPQPEPPPTTSDTQPAQVLSPPATSPSPEAERRQLTVMFCDL